MDLSAIRCSLQVALLGAITANLRAVNIICDKDLMWLNFYYENSPSETETELSEIVVSEVWANFNKIVIKVNRRILSLSEQIPEEGVRVYQRYEPAPEGDL